ncbi:hypothetical protein CW751_09875 [Brumimicrobium salinarum]|uniref:Uncharacterized protein n=1 Tax=Brumimicrobium salinarum TaxID=2058658 RepID=A0A2I0R1I9_9FLAO|nr:hypothetical protein [Brumimicrobium salinarum]PKR80451.1 hypothetical protein CW751_09875 [Brumimicrobium salinarum]
MKKLITICILAFAITTAQSQTVNDVPLNEIDVEYIQIVGTSKLFKNEVTIQIDFGQENKFFRDNTRVKDENGKLLSFNSMIDALNFMSHNGYEFVQAYALTIGNQNVYHYLMRKSED